jgi:N-acetylmuramoyl-L-alanine amidase
MRPIDGIIVHCTATRPDWWADKTPQEQVEEVRRWHVQDNGWSDIGYHDLIARDGTVLPGRPISQVGAHAKGHNATTIGISMFGGHGSSADDDATEHFTTAQLDALYALIRRYQNEFSIPDANIIGHNRVSTKACPGFRVQSWLNSRRAAASASHRPERASPAQSSTIQVSAVDLATKAGAGVSAVAMLDGIAQYLVIGFIGLSALLTLYIMRERLRAWAAGWR